MTLARVCFALGLLTFAVSCTPEATDDEEVKESIVNALTTETVSTRLTVELSKQGAIKVLRAVEQPGKILMNEALLGEFLYQVQVNGTTVATESFPDPFEVHSISTTLDQPGQEGRDPHFVSETDTAVIQVKVPGKSLSTEDYDVVVQQLVRKPSEARVTPQTVASMSRQGALSNMARLKATDIRPLLRKGTKFAANVHKR